MPQKQSVFERIGRNILCAALLTLGMGAGWQEAEAQNRPAGAPAITGMHTFAAGGLWILYTGPDDLGEPPAAEVRIRFRRVGQTAWNNPGAADGQLRAVNAQNQITPYANGHLFSWEHDENGGEIVTFAAGSRFIGGSWEFQIAYTNGQTPVAWSPLRAATIKSPREVHSATLAAGPGAFHIAWIPNRIVEGSPPPAITGWKVLYRKSGTTTWSEVDISDADARSHTQTGLDSETAYEVQVAATNSTGTGVLPASPYTVTTLAGSLSSSSIPQPPANLRATQIGKNLALTWDAPTSGDTVSTYQIRWRVGATTAERDAAPWSSPVQVTQRTLTLAGISGAALYEVQVASITGTILSFPALTAWEATLRWPEIIHPEKPTNLSATQSGNNLALTWDAPTGGVTVSTYQVRWRTGATEAARNNAAWSDPVTVKGLSHTIPGISNAVFYQAEVASLTDQLLTFPEFIRWQTRTEGPETTVLVTPRNFAATRGDGEVTLAWDAPAGAGPYSTYSVRFKTGADEAALTAAQYGDPVAATALTYAITVANNERYMAQVAAINDNEPDFISWDATVQSAAPEFADAAFELPTLYVRADAYSIEFPAATSPDSTPINYTLGGLPANSGLTFAADTRILSGIPTAEAVAAGEATLAYAATDSTAFSVEQQIPIRFGEFDMDVDESGTVDNRDSVLVARYLLGVTGAALTFGQTGAAAENVADRIAGGKADASGHLDVDGDSDTDADDGILIARYMFGLRGAALVDGIGDLQESDASGIEAKIAALPSP